MTDARLRRLEKEWQAAGTVEAHAAYLRAALQSGSIEEESILGSAYEGDPAAVRALGEGQVGCFEMGQFRYSVVEASFVCGRNDLALVVGQAGVVIWDLDTGETQRLQERGGLSPSIAVSPNGRAALISESSMGSDVQMWGMQDGELRGEQSVPAHVVGAAWSPRGGVALLATGDGLFRILLAAEPVVDRISQAREFRSVAFSPDGNSATAGVRNGIEVWNLDEEYAAAHLRGHAGFVESVKYSPKGSIIISGGEDRTVRVWDAAKEKEIACLQGHEGPVASISVNPLVQRVLSASLDGTVRLWDLPTRTEVRCIEAHEGGASSIAWSADGTHAISAGRDRAARAWRLPGVTDHALRERSKPATYSPKLALRSGDEIRHVKFGVGVVQSTTAKHAVVEFDDGVRKLAHQGGR